MYLTGSLQMSVIIPYGTVRIVQGIYWKELTGALKVGKVKATAAGSLQEIPYRT